MTAQLYSWVPHRIRLHQRSNINQMLTCTVRYKPRANDDPLMQRVQLWEISQLYILPCLYRSSLAFNFFLFKHHEVEKKSVKMVRVVLWSMLFLWGWIGKSVGAGIEEKCGADFQKVVVCLSYATGKAATPTKNCCDTVKGIKDSDPECLCYIMQQTHKGNEQIKNMGIQEAKLLQLPSACSLKNASLSDCPKLLGLSPTSPDAAIFTNASTAATPAAPVSTTPGTGNTTSSPEKAGKDSFGAKLEPHLATVLIAMAMAIVFIALPSGSAMFAGN